MQYAVRVLLCSLCCLFAMPSAQAGIVDRLLDTVGGAEVWRDRSWVHTWAVNHHPDARLPYTQEGWIYLREPRHRLELCNFDMQRARAYTADAGWGISEGRFYEFDAERLASDVRFWQSTIYRKLHLLAVGAPATVADVTDNRVHVTHAGDYLGWIGIDPATAAPVSAGSDKDGEPQTVFGPLAEFGDVNWMTTGRTPDGWSFETLAFELLGEEAEVPVNARADTDRLCRR